MKTPKTNVTVTLDEPTARWARVQAARLDTSLSEYLGSLLRAQMQQETAYEEAMQSWLARSPAHISETSTYPTRDELHERTGIR